jgi:molybdopterin-dependent oxidoreductase alpha subunit
MSAEPQSPNLPPPPTVGGGLPVLQYWANQTLSADGPKLWQTLFHKSACLSCAWGTGGQRGGFVNEDGEVLQRCAKSVEAIASELQPGLRPHFFDHTPLADLQQLTSEQANNLGRLSFPVIRRAGRDRYERITWEEVYALTTAAFQKPPARVASYSSGRSSNEAAFLLQLMLRALGSNNLADCSDLCHAASTVGLKQMFGSGTSMVSLEGLKQADCVVLIGSNAPANHPRLLNELIQLRDRGGKVIVINPCVEVGLVKFASPAYPIKSMLSGGSEISSLYLQPIPGSDVALFVGIQKALIEQNLAQIDFLKSHTENWQSVVDQAQSTDWDTIVQTCGVSLAEIEVAAKIIGHANAVVFAWAMGVTQQANGVDNIFSIANTALLSGNAGKPGAGTMPIRGHSNVQGFGSMGVTVKLRQDIQTALEKLLDRPLSRVAGYDTRALIDAADAHQVDTLLCLGGNLYAANPDLNQVKRALGNIETIIYMATKPNVGHFHGLANANTIIIPVFTRFENPHRTTVESGNNFVRLNDPGETHLKQADLISEVEFLTELAHRLHGDTPVNWRKLQDTAYVRQLIAQTIPGYAAISEIDTTQAEFTIAGRIFTAPTFATPSGKAQMFVTPLPDLVLPRPTDFGVDFSQGIVLALGTGRSYSQHNTVVYKPGDRYRGMPHRNCILMNASDAATARFVEHQRVTVQGDAGKLEQVEIIYGNIRPGAAMMFYPEVNVIFHARIDARSGTPAFKRVPVLVYAPVDASSTVSASPATRSSAIANTTLS